MSPTDHAPVYFMALDVIQGVLARAHRLGDVAEYVVTTMRELTGARTTCLYEGTSQRTERARVLAVSPDRRRGAVSPSMCAGLWHRWRDLGEPRLLALEAIANDAVRASLADVVRQGTIVLPLAAHGGDNGALFLFDPPDHADRLDDVFAFIHPLQTLLGLVLSQSLLLEYQEQTLAERTAALAHSESFYRTLFAASPYPIVLTNPETGCFLDMNGAFEDLVGRTRTDLLGKHHRIIHAPDALKTAEGMILGFAESRDDPGPARTEVIARPDGAVREVEIRVRIVPELAPPAMLGFFDDVTERNRLAREERRLQEQLIQSQKMEALGSLAGGIAHDFNNLLSGIRGFSELAMLDLEDRPETQEYLTHVVRAADRAKDIVQQILAFSRSAASEFTDVDVAAVADEAVRLIRSSAPVNVVCKVDLDRQAGRVRAHATQIHQIIVNLCTNAVYAMRPSGGTLTVSVVRVELRNDHELAAGSYLQLTVSDTGTGMDEATQARIFEPYFTTKPVGQGTGLGLSVVHGIVKSTGGTLRVQSTLGRGSTFALFLPAGSREPAAVRGQDEVVTHGKAKILLVDDEPGIVQLGQAMLQGLGYQVTALTDSRAALAIFERDPNEFDLVVTDQIMPGLTGTEILKRMVKLRPGLPTILCSGFSDELDETQAQDTGVVAYLQKPFSRVHLANTVARALAKASPLRS